MKKKVKRKNFCDDNLLILTEWFEKNRDNPYATVEIKHQLAFQTKLTPKQVSDWLRGARNMAKKNKNPNSILFKIKKNRILKNHFYNINQKPNYQDMDQLAQLIGISRKKIISWFAMERFKNKKNKKKP